jgi:hypothetical protein
MILTSDSSNELEQHIQGLNAGLLSPVRYEYASQVHIFKNALSLELFRIIAMLDPALMASNSSHCR